MTNSKTTAADENIPDDFSENFIGEGDEEEPPQWFMDMIQKARKKAMKNFPPAPPGVCNDFSEEDKNACEGFYEDENEDFCEGLCEYEYFCENFCKKISNDQWLIDLVRNIRVDITPRPGFKEELLQRILAIIDEVYGTTRFC